MDLPSTEEQRTMEPTGRHRAKEGPSPEEGTNDPYGMLVSLHEDILEEHRYDEEDPCELARKLAALRTELHKREDRA